MRLRWLVLLAVLALVTSQEAPTRSRSRFRARQRVRPSSEAAKAHRRRPTTTPEPTTTRRPATTTAPEKTAEGTLLVPPIPHKCAERPKHWKLGNHWYFYSADLPEFRLFDPKLQREVGKKYDWLDARNVCRKFCMDSIGMETEEEWNMIRNNVTERKMVYLWTSGRLCDFKGCETREDLKPLDVLGWFWSNTNTKLAPTNSTPPGWEDQPWSQTGHLKKPQPDNAEFGINRTPESCLGVLNSIYEDGVTFHDIGCYHEKPVICEDSEVLLNYARALNKRDGLGLTIE